MVIGRNASAIVEQGENLGADESVRYSSIFRRAEVFALLP
jgi:hypothetical protein